MMMVYLAAALQIASRDHSPIVPIWYCGQLSQLSHSFISADENGEWVLK